MALARSASGPGGLSINTSSANSLFGTGTTPAAGMFGSTQASKPLFGASTTTTAPQSGGLFGSTTGTSTGGLLGSTATSQPQAAGGLFGSSTSQPQTSGLFGSATTTSQPQTGGLFGSTSNTSQPQAGGLFGSTATTTQPQSSGLFGSTQPSGGLFGNTNTSQAAPSTGMFSNAGTGQAQNTGTSLFGSSTTQPTQGGGLFGQQNSQKLFGTTQNQQNQPQGGSSLFPSLSQPQQQSQPQGGLQFGQSNSQQQQTVPGVRIDITNIRGTTRFNDLHDELQKQIDHLDSVIQQQIQIKNDISAILPAHNTQLSNIPNDVEFCRRKLIGLDAAMSSDIESIGNVQKLVTKDIEHAKLSFKAADNLRLPPQYHIAGVWPSKSTTSDNRSQNGDSDAQQDIVGYFSSTADELSSTLSKYQKNIGEIELHLRNVENNSAQQVASLVARRNGGSASDEDAIRELAAALAEFEQGILHVAGKVGGAREGVQTLQLGAFTGPADGTVKNGNRSGIY